MLAWDGSDPIDCTHLQKVKKEEYKVEILKNKCLAEWNFQDKKQPGALLHDYYKVSCGSSDT
ncbi:hypothetical protein O0555_11025 [Brevibacillus laterosporus]|uniref:hypothetical protein n=1 Tax=Brevibacillus laterosporus TaxID=1465 RepID=UPI000CE2EF83|nr:hypothetical protein [Brevibacillus laterosporus]MBG9800213.1 hypothetical protein [Brevibacillus laterosporus]MCR8937880.1 hypothetical protein [Brevibacillus laterosporus]MCZ0840519.1 hypothetical protein [Brevibacillus laterosporus]MCZ0847427.1 hypothetical protein [Brevibacillus laterosporus]MED1911251.1 hypothetical protein [Brevibacillus laterosporus]